MQYPLRIFGGMGELFFLAMTFGSFLLHLIIAIGVYLEASRRSAAGRKLWFMGPFFWTIATLLGGVLTAVTYWAMHHSMLARPDAEITNDE